MAKRARPDSTTLSATNMASVPALHANSKSATCTWGPMPSASTTTVPLGLTA
jgi:hypothetical protein